MHDPNPHTFYYSGVESGTRGAVEWARAQRYEPTSINTSVLSSVSSLTDVVVYDEDYSTFCGYTWHPAGIIGGHVQCVSLAAGNRCEKHEARYDLSWMNSETVNGRNIIACHETGHTLGLTHRNAEPGCMNHPLGPGELTEHDVAHLNGGWQTLYANWTLLAPAALVSWDGSHRAVMQDDGNLVVYGPTGAIWSSTTNGYRGSYAVMQGDGNFVIYQPQRHWARRPMRNGHVLGSRRQLHADAKRRKSCELYARCAPERCLVDLRRRFVPMTGRAVARVVVSSVLLLGGCAESEPSDESSADARQSVVDFLQGRSDVVVRTPPWYRTLDELLPNVDYRHPDGRTQTLTDLAVIGRITSVEKGRGFVVPGEDAPDGQPVAYDTPGARWWTLHATVEIERAIASSEAPSEVRIAMPSGPPAEFGRLAQGLRALGRVVLPLVRNNPVVAYDSSLLAVFEDGTFVVTVADDGTLALPTLDAELRAPLLAKTPKLEDLEASGRQPRRTIPLRDTPTGPVRADG
jgi:hypothetical protein